MSFFNGLQSILIALSNIGTPPKKEDIRKKREQKTRPRNSPYTRLSTEIPNLEIDIFIRHCLDVEPDGRYSGDDFTYLKAVQYRGLRRFEPEGREEEIRRVIWRRLRLINERGTREQSKRSKALATNSL